MKLLGGCTGALAGVLGEGKIHRESLTAMEEKPRTQQAMLALLMLSA